LSFAAHKKAQFFPCVHARLPNEGLGINLPGFDERLKLGFADGTHLTIPIGIV
jgi:hypothetical protein